jgi:hypothetical protein
MLFSGGVVVGLLRPGNLTKDCYNRLFVEILDALAAC